MQELNVEVTVEGLEDPLNLDIAGFSNAEEFRQAIAADIEEFLDGLGEEDRANIETTETPKWAVSFFDPCEEAWVFEDTFSYPDWQWPWVEYFGKRDTEPSEVCEAAEALSVTPKGLQDAYCGEHNSDEEFAQSLAEEVNSEESTPKWPYTCVDWEQAASELMVDYGEHNQHYFRSL